MAVLLPLGARMRLSKSNADLYAAIRRDHRAGMSMRGLQRKFGVTWQRVREALDWSGLSRARSCPRVRPGWIPTGR